MVFPLLVLLGLFQTRSPEADNGYVGAETCSQCHAPQHASWLRTPHAAAYERLPADEKQAGPGCVACHGPGRRHARRPERWNILGRPTRRICDTCHTSEQAPGLGDRFASMLAEVDHRVATEAAEAAVRPADVGIEPEGHGPVTVELFVMPHCPYGMEAESVLAEVIGEFGDDVEFRLHFIAEAAGEDGLASDDVATHRGTDRPACEGVPTGGGGRFRSLHGDEEVAEGIRQTAVMELYPDRYLDYLLCRNKAIHRDNWAACAEAADMDPVRIDILASSAEGEALFAENIRRGNQLGVRASPTLRIGGREIEAVFDASAVARRICGENDVGAPCRDLPECGSDQDCVRPGKVGICVDAGGRSARCRYSDPVPFEMVVLNDTDCVVCETGHVIRSTVEFFPGARVRTVAVGSSEGQALVRLHGIDRVPAFVMGEAFGLAARFPRFERRTRRTPGGYVADAGIVPVAKLLGREAQPGRTDLCMKSASGFALRSALGVLGWVREGRPADRLRLHVLPLVEGPLAGEVPYQLCVRELFPGRYLDYLACRMAGIVEADDSRSNDGCARLAGVDLEAIRRCMAGGEAERLLEAENRWIDASGVSSGSVPLTLVIDNRYVVGPAMLSAVDEVVRRVSAEGVGTDGG